MLFLCLFMGQNLRRGHQSTSHVIGHKPDFNPFGDYAQHTN